MLKIKRKTLPLFVYLLFSIFNLEGYEPRLKVAVYAGPGVSPNCLRYTLTTLKTLLDSRYNIETILPQQVIEDDWEEETALFVMPAGADMPYCEALNGMGNQKIAEFVEHGGSYLGICAGAYYSGNFVDFSPGTDMEVVGPRELGFFPGTVRGPILAPYDYCTNSGVRAATVMWKEAPFLENATSFTVYYNGGGYFVDAWHLPNVKVLASYNLGDEFPVIVECKRGLGKAILSCVHVEIDPAYLDPNDPYYGPLIPQLEPGNQDRMLLMKHVLSRLSLMVAS